jgi:hypothetical protein
LFFRVGLFCCLEAGNTMFLRTAVPQLRRLVAGWPRSVHVEFVVDALGRVFSEYFGFPCQFSFRRLLHNHYLSSGAGTVSQIVADVPSGLSLTPPQKTKKKSYETIYQTTRSHVPDDTSHRRENLSRTQGRAPANTIMNIWIP